MLVDVIAPAYFFCSQRLGFNNDVIHQPSCGTTVALLHFRHYEKGGGKVSFAVSVMSTAVEQTMPTPQIVAQVQPQCTSQTNQPPYLGRLCLCVTLRFNVIFQTRSI